MERKNHKKRNIIMLIIFAIAIILFYNIFLLIISNYDEENGKDVLGFRAYVIMTDSMNPTLKNGDIVIVHKDSKIEAGNIVTYKKQETSETITHRISRTTKDGYITKGDSNLNEDSNIISQDEIIGKVVLRLPFIGKYITSLKKIRYLFIILIIVLTLALHKKRTNRKKIVRRLKKESEDNKFKKEDEKE